MPNAGGDDEVHIFINGMSDEDYREFFKRVSGSINLCESDKDSIFYDSIVNTDFVLQKGRKTLIHTIFPLNLLPDNATVGQKIRYYRLKRHMTYNILSEKMGTSRYALMDYENDLTEPDLDILKSIAAALEIEPAELFDEYYCFLDYPYSIIVVSVKYIIT